MVEMDSYTALRAFQPFKPFQTFKSFRTSSPATRGMKEGA